MAKKDVSLIGLTFGKLKVESMLPRGRYKNGAISPAKYLCRCDCGNTKIVEVRSLLNGGGTSCGNCGKTEKWWHDIKKIGCLSPFYMCEANRAGVCCRDCPKRSECPNVCLNDPSRCGI